MIVGSGSQCLTAIEMFLTSFVTLFVVLLVPITKGIILAHWFLGCLTYWWLNMIVINWARVWLLLFIKGEITLFTESKWHFTIITTASQESITLIRLITHWHLLFHISQVRWLVKLLRCTKVILYWRKLIVVSRRTVLSWRWWTLPHEVYLVGWVPGHACTPTHWKWRLVCMSRIGLFVTDQFRQIVITWSSCIKISWCCSLKALHACSIHHRMLMFRFRSFGLGLIVATMVI